MKTFGWIENLAKKQQIILMGLSKLRSRSAHHDPSKFNKTFAAMKSSVLQVSRKKGHCQTDMNNCMALNIIDI